MKLHTPLALLTILSLAASESSSRAQGTNSVSTTPVGFVTINISAGTGTTRKSSLVSVPLLTWDTTLPSRGTVSSVKDSKTIVFTTSNTSDSGSAVLPQGSLSNPASPFLVRFVSGDAEGHMLLVSTTTPNTTTELTLADPHDSNLNLAQMGVKPGDKFSIHPCDTLLSFFGTPQSTGIRGGTSAVNADNITMIFNGSASTYFYSTSLNRWARVGLGNPNANNTPILPYYGIQYGRLDPTPLQLIAIGEVPTGKRKVKIRANGSTLLASYWPVDTTLASSPIRGIPSWRVGANTTLADRISLVINGSSSSFFHNGSSWRRVSLGNPLGDNQTFPLAGATMLSKTTPNTTTAITLEDTPPYSF